MKSWFFIASGIFCNSDLSQLIILKKLFSAYCDIWEKNFSASEIFPYTTIKVNFIISL